MKDAAQSLLVQSMIQPKRLQADGWGLGWFHNHKPRIHKSSRPLFEDQASLLDACRKAEGNTLVGHVRWASNPLKLPKDQLIGLPHTQPFTHESWVFAHNGTLLIPREVRRALGSWEQFIQGRNDSEVLFFWLLKHLYETPQAHHSSSWIKKSFRELHAVWQNCRKRYPLYKYPYHGVNWVLTNGDILYAFCYVNGDGFDKGKALCNPRESYYQMRLFQTPYQFLIASEPLFLEAGWESLSHGELVVAHRQNKKMLVYREQIFHQEAPCENT